MINYLIAENIDMMWRQQLWDAWPLATVPQVDSLSEPIEEQRASTLICSLTGVHRQTARRFFTVFCSQIKITITKSHCLIQGISDASL